VITIASRRNWGTVDEADEIGKQQLKWTQMGSSSWSRHNQGAVAEVDVIGEQELKQAQSGSSNWIREQQLKEASAASQAVWYTYYLS